MSAKRDRSRYPHNLSQSADFGQRRSGAVRGSKATCLVRHQAARPAGDVAGARHRGGRVGGLSAAVDEDCHHAVLPRVIKSRILEARGTRSLDRRLVPKICKHVTAVMAGDMSARQAADPFLQERIRCCAQPLRPPDRASPGSGYALPPSAYPRRHSHPDCRSILTLIVARYVNSTRLSSIGPAPFITSW